jgi:hypothetical protein
MDLALCKLTVQGSTSSAEGGLPSIFLAAASAMMPTGLKLLYWAAPREVLYV